MTAQRSAEIPRIITEPCPFCGEAEHLRIHEFSITRPIVVGADTLKGPDGAEVLEEVDAVACDVCEAMAPYDVWERLRPARVFGVLRDFEPIAGAA